MKLNQLSDNLGARKGKNRVGRGIGSGNGKTAGRGHKGQLSRSGGKVRIGFEGGQNPLYQRLPMRGFSNANFTKSYCEVNVGDLQALVDAGRLDAKKPITIEVIQSIGMSKKAKDGLKVLGTGELKTALTIEAAGASKSAMEKVSKAGGTLTVAEVKENPRKLPKKETAAKAKK